MKTTVRSAEYAYVVRYRAAGVGVDTNRWELHLKKEEDRCLRHKLILSALFDQVLSPDGAKAATLLPHLTSVSGAIVIRTSVGRATSYSALAQDFREMINKLVNDSTKVYLFDDLSGFTEAARYLLDHSVPARPPGYKS
jgi:CRISPR/Cas system-associated protein Cas7 (RAMP superfamily)